MEKTLMMKLGLAKPPQDDQALEPLLKKARLALVESLGEFTNKASKLKQLLAEHETQLQKAKDLAARITDADLKRLVESQQGRYLIADAKQLAKLVLAAPDPGAELATVISDDRGPIEKRLYGDPNRPPERDYNDNLRLMTAWDVERAAVAILRSAILLHQVATAELRKSAMLKFAGTIAEARTSLARKFLAAMKDAQQLMTEDSRILEGLGLGHVEVELLRPKPFPAVFLSDALVDWLFDLVSQQLIGAQDLAGLRLTTPARQS
jgi:hypothetical protein